MNTGAANRRSAARSGRNPAGAWLLILLLPLAGCSDKTDGGWLGYAEGDYVFIGAPQPGWLTELTVQRGQAVHKGDLLFTLDDTQQQASRDQAQASLDQAKASLAQEEVNLKFLTIELNRQAGLARVKAGTPSTREQAENNARQSREHSTQLRAQISQMTAALAGADYALSQRRIIAQTEGSVEDVFFYSGEYVGASTSVISVLPPASIYVRFFVPEKAFSRIRLGQKVQVNCDGCGPMEAAITFIARRQEYTPPVIFSVESREKLVFKVEARAPGGLPVHPGQPVEVRPL